MSGRRCALDRYAALPSSVRWHAAARLSLCTPEPVLPWLPEAGLLADVGCGYGQFCHWLSCRLPGLSVLGLDGSPRRVAAARLTQTDKVRFREGGFADLPGLGARAVLAMDVLYLIPKEVWPELFRLCRKALASGGVLLIKETVGRFPGAFPLVKLQEAVMTKVFGISRGIPYQHIPPDRVRELLREAGWQARTLDVPGPLHYTQRWHIAQAS
jgi:trans-aconitate 2-methyltransferase